METINVIIEKGEEQFYCAYTETPVKGLGINGYGQTPDEAMKDFMEVYEDFRKNEGCPELSFHFKYDTRSFLCKYKEEIPQTAICKITGINSKQLSQYLTGKRHPSPRTTRKIQEGIRKFGEELSQLDLV